MKIEVNVGKKYAFLIVASVFILAGIFAVYAYNSNPNVISVPSVFGHSANEVELVNYLGSGENVGLSNKIEDLDSRLTAIDFIDSGELASGLNSLDPFSARLTSLSEFEDYLDTTESEAGHPGILSVSSTDPASTPFNVDTSEIFNFATMVKSSNFQTGAFNSGLIGKYYFKFGAGSGKIQTCVVNTCTDTSVTNSGLNNKWVKLRIEADTTNVIFYLNDVNVKSVPRAPGASGSANVGSTSGAAYKIDYVALKVSALRREVGNCNTPIGSSGESDRPRYVNMSVPPICMSGRGCIIRQEIMKSGAVYATRYYPYLQQSDGKWKSSYSSSVRTNGDGNYNNVITAYASDSILLRDDSSVERDASKWTMYDNSATYGQTLTACAYS